MTSPNCAYLLLILVVQIDCMNALLCWHCISDGCSGDPTDDSMASELYCSPGQSCQKVYFEMNEVGDSGSKLHTSVVRGCAAECRERNDFTNCSEILRNSRGCVQKTCCYEDLCNESSRAKVKLPFLILLLIFCNLL